MNIIDECMESLGENVHVLSNDNKEQVLGLFESTFHLQSGGELNGVKYLIMLKWIHTMRYFLFIQKHEDIQ